MRRQKTAETAIKIVPPFPPRMMKIKQIWNKQQNAPRHQPNLADFGIVISR